MNSINNVQQLLSGLQQQLSSMSSLANNLSALTPENIIPALTGSHALAPPTDIPALVASLVATEMEKHTGLPKSIPSLPPPAVANDVLAPEPAASQLALPVTDTSTLPPTAYNVVDSTTPTSNVETTGASPDMKDIMMRSLMSELKSAIGCGLTSEQQIFISSNLFSLPGFFRSAEGKSCVQNMLVAYINSLPK